MITRKPNELMEKIWAYEKTVMDAYRTLMDEPAYRAIRDKIKASGFNDEEIWVDHNEMAGDWFYDYKRTGMAIRLSVDRNTSSRSETGLTLFEMPHSRICFAPHYAVKAYSVRLGLAFVDKYADQKVDDFLEVVEERRLTWLCLKQISLSD